MLFDRGLYTVAYKFLKPFVNRRYADCIIHPSDAKQFSLGSKGEPIIDQAKTDRCFKKCDCVQYIL